MSKFDLGVIYIHTKYDDISINESRKKFLDFFPNKNFLFFTIDGDETTDLTKCLNLGIDACIKTGCKYLTWLHSDMTYDDADWFTKLSKISEENPSILKNCFANSRDTIYPLRLGHEQQYLMRVKDFIDKPWLWFNQSYIGIGGVEDLHQSLQILGRGYLVTITPETHLFHQGMGSRVKHDTNPQQLYNHAVFGQLTGFGCVKEVHLKEHFGIGLDEETFYRRLSEISTELVKQLDLPTNYSKVLENRIASGINMEFFK